MTSPTILGYQADQGLIEAMQRLYGAQRARIGGLRGPQQAALGAQRGVLSARAGTFGPRRNVRYAQAGVYNAQERQLGTQRSYLDLAAQFNNQRTQELRGLIAARDDSRDVVGVAAATQRRNSYLGRFQAGGIPTTEVDLPIGQDSNQPGVFARYQTRFERERQYQGDLNAGRDLQLQGAQLAVQLAGTDVDQARIAAGRAGLTLDEAEDMVSMAQLGADSARLDLQEAGQNYEYDEDMAQLGVNEARLAGSIADMPPAPGMVRWNNPITGLDQWVLPYERTYLNEQYGIAEGRLGGDLGGVGIQELQGYLVEGLLSDQDVINELVRRGRSPGYAQLVVQEAAAIRGRRRTGGGDFDEDELNTPGGAPGAPGRTGGGGPPTTGQQVDAYLEMLQNLLYEEWLAGAR